VVEALLVVTDNIATASGRPAIVKPGATIAGLREP
jgi:hypothetical protein